MEGIHGRIRYLGRKGKSRKYKRDSQRVQKGIPTRYRRCKITRKRKRNIQKRRTARTIYSKKAIWMVRQTIWRGILGKTRKKLKTIERRIDKRTKNYGNNKGERRRNWAGKFRAQGVDKRRWQWNGKYLRPILWTIKILGMRNLEREMMLWHSQKWLSHYLFSFSFSFLLIRKLVDMQDETTKRDV